MNRNTLMLIIGVLIVMVGVLGYMLYDAKKEPTGFQINVGKDGIKVEQK
jgi:predicted negative regulator of RcsB-dependent stress response